MRSIPEKTLEHWCSIHLTYRYRARLRMWWPTDGEDISVSGGPLAPGKRFWLELKTTEWNKKGKRHDLIIDLDQLAAYGRHGVPDFYVFPTPPWSGVLGQAPKPTWASGFDPSDFAYQTHSGDKWFPRWLYVVPGSALRRIVSGLPPKTPRKTRASTGGGKKPAKQKNLLRVAKIEGDQLTWLIPSPRADELLPWHDFWRRMETCGNSGAFAAQFLLPANTAGLSSPLPPAPRGGSHAPSSGPNPPASASAKDVQATTTWNALKSAVSKLKAAEKAPNAETASFAVAQDGAMADDLLIWSPMGELFVASKPSQSTPPADDFVWTDGVGRGMVLLTIDALRV